MHNARLSFGVLEGFRVALGHVGRGIAIFVLERGQVSAHGVGVFPVGVVFGLDLADGELERLLVQVESGAIALPHVQRNVFGVEGFHHGARGLSEEVID